MSKIIYLYIFISLLYLPISFSKLLHKGPNEAIAQQLPNQFTIFNWNLHKGKDEGFNQDFNRLVNKYDIITAQETLMNDFMLKLFGIWSDYEWYVVESWTKKDRPTGVGTLSRVKSIKQIPLKSAKEPFAGTPKTSLITNYKLKNNKTLLVINVHGLLLVSKRKYKKQMDDVINIAKQHAGPIVWAGDFNTWRKNRWKTLEYIKTSLNLSLVEYKNDLREEKDMRVLDHILYRGLKLVSSQMFFDIDSSDHIPQLAQFEAL